jgi:hypothetical protein
MVAPITKSMLYFIEYDTFEEFKEVCDDIIISFTEEHLINGDIVYMSSIISFDYFMEYFDDTHGILDDKRDFKFEEDGCFMLRYYKKYKKEESI